MNQRGIYGAVAGSDATSLTQTPPSDRRLNPWAALFIVLIALACGVVGADARPPMDSHDIFVARPAQRMLRTGDYLIPMINGKPRLNKPPLDYWLVAACDRIMPGCITPLEARLPSILAG